MTSFVTQTTLGKWFQLSPIKVGRILVALGLKDRHGPTTRAINGSYAKEAATKQNIKFFLWDADKVTPLIDEALGGENPSVEEWACQVCQVLSEAARCRIGGSD